MLLRRPGECAKNNRRIARPPADSLRMFPARWLALQFHLGAQNQPLQLLLSWTNKQQQHPHDHPDMVDCGAEWNRSESSLNEHEYVFLPAADWPVGKPIHIPTIECRTQKHMTTRFPCWEFLQSIATEFLDTKKCRKYIVPLKFKKIPVKSTWWSFSMPSYGRCA